MNTLEDRVQMNVRIHPDLKARIAAYALSKGVTVNAAMARILDETVPLIADKK